MNITVFGATGRTGRPFIEHAIINGHTVTAFVRSKEKLGEYASNVRVVEGDIYNAESVRTAVENADALVSTLGPVKGSPDDMMRVSAENILGAMQSVGVKRIIWQTGAGVIHPDDPPAPMRTIIRTLMKVVAGKVLKSSQDAFNKIIESGMDYTIFRVPMLNEAPATGAIHSTYTPPKPKPISREDIAVFMLRALENDDYIKKAPMLEAGSE